VDAAGVVAEVPADRATGMARGIGTEDHPDLGAGLLVELLIDDARLADDGLRLSVGVADFGQVLGVVDDDREVDRLARQAGAATAIDDRRPEVVTGTMGGHDVIEGLGDHDADRYLAVVRRIGGIQGLGAGVKADLAVNLLLQPPPQAAHVDAGRARHATGEPRVDAYGDRFGSSGHDTSQRRASARLSSSPSPGRDRSGRSSPPSGESVPSKSMDSIR
jgi:hypothetical protein